MFSRSETAPFRLSIYLPDLIVCPEPVLAKRRVFHPFYRTEKNSRQNARGRDIFAGANRLHGTRPRDRPCAGARLHPYLPPVSAGAKRKDAFFEAIVTIERSFYQDSLGTNIGKVEIKRSFMLCYLFICAFMCSRTATYARLSHLRLEPVRKKSCF